MFFRKLKVSVCMVCILTTLGIIVCGLILFKDKLHGNLEFGKDSLWKLSDIQLKLHDRESILTIDDLPIDAGFEPNVDVEFPTVAGTKPRIPHIIHQMWTSKDHLSEDASIPSIFVDNVKSFMNNNPTWTYFFWTETTARALMAKRYKHLLNVYESIQIPVVKSDILRYVVVYEFGGFYADLDIFNFRGLDILTMKYPCILLAPTFANAVVEFSWPYYILNSQFFCRPRHPFFKQVLDSLPNAVRIGNTIAPEFFTKQYLLYNNITNMYRVNMTQGTSPYFYKGTLAATDENGIYIPNSRYFYSPWEALEELIEYKCKEKEQSKLVKRMCAEVRQRGYLRRSGGVFTFTAHSYAHSWHASNAMKKFKYVSIRSIVKTFRTY